MILIVPQAVTGLNIFSEYYSVMNITVSFEWDPPPGSGPEVIVDNYTITIIPEPVSHNISNTAYSTELSVILNYNVIYTATVAAQNCAGESESVVLSNIEYGKAQYIF